MATYKVLQDIEAEDKFVGPLTLRQFIFACIAAICGYLSFFALTKKAGFLLVFFVPIMLFMGVFAWPWHRDQPTEVWILAKLRFLFKPHKRIWDQSGVQQLVTVTAPKVQERTLTNNLNQTEVRSRLNALANTIDSRGWAIKNVNVNLSAPATTVDDSDRLISAASLPQAVSVVDVHEADDILDPTSNPVAQQFENLIQASDKAHREAIVKQMRESAQNPTKAQTPTPDYWFMNQSSASPAPTGYATFTPKTVLPGAGEADSSVPQPTAEEQAVLQEIKAEQAQPDNAYSHLKKIQPMSAKSQEPRAKSSDSGLSAQDSQLSKVDPAILSLAGNDDLNVATIARQAKKDKRKQSPDDEVVIPLR